VSGRVLLIRFSSLGDVILTEPVIRGLRREDPGIETVLLTRKLFAPLFSAHPDLQSVWTLEESPRLANLRKRVGEGGFERVVDLHGSLRSRAITFGAGVPTTRTRSFRIRRLLLTARRPFKRRLPVPPVVDRHLAAAGMLPESGVKRWPALRLPEEVLREGAGRVKELRGSRRGVVALIPGARHAPKRWPLPGVIELAGLLDAGGWRPVAIPPPDDLSVGEGLQQAAPRLTLLEDLEDPALLGGFLAACSGAVCNDSGPMHLAAAMGTAVVGLFGPTSPELGFAPLGERACFLHLGLSCSPCSRHGSRPCYRDRRYCMEDIPPGRVLEALEGLMA